MQYRISRKLAEIQVWQDSKWGHAMWQLVKRDELVQMSTCVIRIAEADV